MKEINLTRGHMAIINDEDYEKVSKIRWYALCTKNTIYAAHKARKGNCSVVLMHRLLLNASKGLVVDHINRNGLDNRRCNIRVCSVSDNHKNSIAKGGSSKFKGVYYRKRDDKWPASITIEGKSRYLGQYATQEEAALAYNFAAKHFYGDFARLSAVSCI